MALKLILRGPILVGALVSIFSLGATAAWAQDLEPDIGTDSAASQRLTPEQIKQFSIDSLDVGDPQPARVSTRSSYTVAILVG